MTTAPEWIWNALMWLSIVAGVAIAILSDPIWARLRDTQATPIISTLVVSIAAAIFVGSTWWFFVAAWVKTTNEGIDQLTIRPGRIVKHMCGDGTCRIWVIEGAQFINKDTTMALKLSSVFLEVERSNGKVKMEPIEGRSRAALGDRAGLALPGVTVASRYNQLQPGEKLGITLIFLEEGENLSDKARARFSIVAQSGNVQNIDYGDF